MPVGASVFLTTYAGRVRTGGGIGKAAEERPRRRALEGNAAPEPEPEPEPEREPQTASPVTMPEGLASEAEDCVDEEGEPLQASGKASGGKRRTTQEQLQRQIREIYRRYVRPEKTSEEVDAILERFASREAELLEKMVKKYQLDDRPGEEVPGGEAAAAAAAGGE